VKGNENNKNKKGEWGKRVGKREKRGLRIDITE
jgi:hypothetical protein